MTTLNKVDLQEYAEKILANEDHPLFDEAVGAAKSGALRAAYIVICLNQSRGEMRRGMGQIGGGTGLAFAGV